MSKTTLKVITYTANGKPSMPKVKRDEIEAFYKRYPDRNIEVKFSVLPKRSSALNRYLWGCVYPIVMEGLNEYGNDFNVEGVHDFCKAKFNEQPVIGEGGEVIGVVGGSTTDFNSDEFYNDYIEKIARFSAEELHRPIPPPGSQANIFFAEYDEDLKATIIE